MGRGAAGKRSGAHRGGASGGGGRSLSWVLKMEREKLADSSLTIPTENPLWVGLSRKDERKE